MRARHIAAVVLLLVLLLCACSEKRPCDYPEGTPLSNTVTHTLIDYGHWTMGPSGRLEFQSCCDLNHPIEDGGCAAACPEPRLQRWISPYFGTCQEDGDIQGSWQCEVIALDGGVVESGAGCVN